jgi:hypothetical protein
MGRILAGACLGSLAALVVGGCGRAVKGEPFRPEVADQNRAVLYVFREAKNFGQPPVRVVVDQEPQGELAPGQYLALSLEPGSHFVRVEAQSEDTREVRLTAGDSVYIRIVTPQFRARRPTLDQPETEAARLLIADTVRAGP